MELPLLQTIPSSMWGDDAFRSYGCRNEGCGFGRTRIPFWLFLGSSCCAGVRSTFENLCALAKALRGYRGLSP